MISCSPLARQIDHQRDVRDRTRPVFGCVVHTTGRTIVQRALRAGADPLDFATGYYADPAHNAAHYVVGWSGQIIQIADERERMAHVGIAAQRQLYLSGEWVKHLPAALVARWRARWPGVKSPAHLFPGRSANDAYVGIEMLPLVPGTDYVPLGDRLWYTAMQHESVRGLVRDIAGRWGFELAGGRLVGHEDVNPITRHNRGGGWDPGALRESPRFDWSWILR